MNLISEMLDKIPKIPRVSEVKTAKNDFRAEIQEPECGCFKHVLDKENEKYEKVCK